MTRSSATANQEAFYVASSALAKKYRKRRARIVYDGEYRHFDEVFWQFHMYSRSRGSKVIHCQLIHKRTGVCACSCEDWIFRKNSEEYGPIVIDRDTEGLCEHLRRAQRKVFIIMRRQWRTRQRAA